jgi:hypothetical protein
MRKASYISHDDNAACGCRFYSSGKETFMHSFDHLLYSPSFLVQLSVLDLLTLTLLSRIEVRVSLVNFQRLLRDHEIFLSFFHYSSQLLLIVRYYLFKMSELLLSLYEVGHYVFRDPRELAD